MERKRKVPPRAAARQEQAARRRNVTTRGASSTPAAAEPPAREPTPPPPPPTPPPPLPKSIEVGKPLPTIEEAQAADLSNKEYQSLTESAVLSESIVRSRHRWISEGLFEKFWTKPHKRKGVLQEDPNNPPKDSMMKVGMVTITVEPHIVEATMFAVKTSKLLPHQQERFHPKPQQHSPGDAQQQKAQTSQTPATTQIRPQQQVKPASEAGQPPQESAHPTPQQTPSALARPVLQYGPHNGSMPPPPMPAPPADTTSAAGTPAESTAHRVPLPANTALPNAPPEPTALTNPALKSSANTPPGSTASPATSTLAPVSKLVSVPAPSAAPAKSATPFHTGATIKSQPFFAPVPHLQSQSPTQHAQAQAHRQAQVPTAGESQKRLPQPSSIASQSAAPAATANSASAQARTAPSPAAISASRSHTAQIACSAPNQSPSPALGKAVAPTGARTAPSAAVSPAKSTTNDPVIALLAQKASREPQLRDLMKRVAVGEAKIEELAQFQKIIDQLNAEYRQKGGQQGPSADRLLVDGRTVKYFAKEVRDILNIVLASNPNQKSSELRPPAQVDPLVVLLVKTALEDQRTKDMIRRIAEGKPGFTDATDLKQILDRLHRDASIAPKASLPGPSPLRAPASSGPPAGGGGSHPKASTPKPTQQNNAQALRSKGPPPASRPDISAVVFDFGSGDRYLFPKYSILEFLPTKSGQQVVASFLIVRKGSTSEYGGDPKLDYYQPVTIRLQTSSGRHLENLARVVAPQDEVRRYMDDVMDNMTRAEYVLLAMRLPRADFDPEEGTGAAEDSKTSSPTPKSEPETDQNSTPKPGVLWTTSRNNKNSNGGSKRNHKATNASLGVKIRDMEQDAQMEYGRFIRSVAEKEVNGL
ncbi:hypothetical protein E4U42_006191 [Claviceps africana]|uniref:SWR1-complex protein 3 domain-containing protein n=1 Tax=Claviceps africana TaxID=83212 RepID=A0A8K0J3B2_9HYPO|nr:hypothetical protein E4U42_006191 [Claviceps africana]